MEMLPALPHKQFLDLTITYDIDLGNNASCRVRNEMRLGVSEDELYEAAIKNARERGYSVVPMKDMITVDGSLKSRSLWKKSIAWRFRS